jgi:hypothetical protein
MNNFECQFKRGRHAEAMDIFSRIQASNPSTRNPLQHGRRPSLTRPQQEAIRYYRQPSKPDPGLRAAVVNLERPLESTGDFFSEFLFFYFSSFLSFFSLVNLSSSFPPAPTVHPAARLAGLYLKLERTRGPDQALAAWTGTRKLPALRALGPPGGPR